MRLQKYLAQAGVASRRKCETYIEQGRVSVNGEIVRVLGSCVGYGDEVRLDGQLLHFEKATTICLYKPDKVICSNGDPQGRATVQDYIQDIPLRLYHIGRLDFDTEGLLLLSNDGALAHALTHPSHQVPKTYLAVCRGEVDPAALQHLRDGVRLDDGVTSPAQAELIDMDGVHSRIKIVLREGRNRQVRRMLDAVGMQVVLLRRDAVGDLTLQGLRPGQWRELREEELAALRTQAGL